MKRLSSARCGLGRVVKGMGWRFEAWFISNKRRSQASEHTSSARAGAHCRFEHESRLRSVNEDFPVNRPPADLLSGEFLDDNHGAAAVRAEPG